MDFFNLSKLFWLLVQPVIVLWLLLGLAALALWKPRRRLAWSFAFIAVCFGMVVQTNVGALWLQQLENAHAVGDLSASDRVAGIIVLGGGFDGTVTIGRGGFAMGEAGDRFVEAAALARQFPDPPIIVSGGDASFIGETEGDALIAPRFFGALGISSDRIILESGSRNTYQNAIFTKALIDKLPHNDGRWLLVTSAFHMKRAVGCFNVAGQRVVAWPVDYRTSGKATFTIGRDDALQGLAQFSLALRETVGLLVYQWTGRYAQSLL